MPARRRWCEQSFHIYEEAFFVNIIIVGDGKVGYTLAQFLSKDGHDITIIDKNT